MDTPYIININTHGNTDLGFIAVLEQQKQIPFAVKRTFWTYHMPEECIRGNHAHRNTQQVLICLQGTIEVTTEMPDQSRSVFILDKPSEALYLPPAAWHTMKYTGNAIQLVLASTMYDESDYFRDYSEYKQYYH